MDSRLTTKEIGGWLFQELNPKCFLYFSLNLFLYQWPCMRVMS